MKTKRRRSRRHFCSFFEKRKIEIRRGGEAADFFGHLFFKKVRLFCCFFSKKAKLRRSRLFFAKLFFKKAFKKIKLIAEPAEGRLFVELFSKVRNILLFCGAFLQKSDRFLSLFSKSEIKKTKTKSKKRKQTGILLLFSKEAVNWPKAKRRSLGLQAEGLVLPADKTHVRTCFCGAKPRTYVRTCARGKNNWQKCCNFAAKSPIKSKTEQHFRKNSDKC